MEESVFKLSLTSTPKQYKIIGLPTHNFSYL